MVAGERIELSTQGLWILCSTTELSCQSLLKKVCNKQNSKHCNPLSSYLAYIYLVFKKLSGFVPHLPPALSKHCIEDVSQNSVSDLGHFSVTRNCFTFFVPDTMLLMNPSPVSDIQFTEETALLPKPLLELSDCLLERVFWMNALTHLANWTW